MKAIDVIPWLGGLLGGHPGVWPEQLDPITGPVTRTVISTLLGAGLGRYGLAPALHAGTMGYGDKKKIRRNATIAGALAGLGLSGIPAYYDIKTGTPAFYKQSSNFISSALFRPTIPMTQSMEGIQTNPWMSFSDKIQAQLALVQAAQREGDSGAGLLKPISLVNFAGQTAATAVPYMIAAYGLSKVLGLPPRLQQGAVGASVVAGAWKSYLDRVNDG